MCSMINVLSTIDGLSGTRQDRAFRGVIFCIHKLLIFIAPAFRLIKKAQRKITMQLTDRQEKGATIVTVQGRIDGVTAPEFENYLLDLVSQGRRTFIINFSSLEYISSAGLRSILATAKRLKTEQGIIYFTGLKGTVEEVFKISGFYSIFKVFDSNESALNNI